MKNMKRYWKIWKGIDKYEKARNSWINRPISPDFFQMFPTFLGDFNPQKLPTRTSRTGTGSTGSTCAIVTASRGRTRAESWRSKVQASIVLIASVTPIVTLPPLPSPLFYYLFATPLLLLYCSFTTVCYVSQLFTMCCIMFTVFHYFLLRCTTALLHVTTFHYFLICVYCVSLLFR